MKLIFTGYVNSPVFNRPDDWLKRINAYTGILERLAAKHTVTGIERINYEGRYEKDGVEYFFIQQEQKTDRFPFRVHRIIKKLRPDVVFVNGFVFPLQIIQLRLALGRRVKIMVINHAEKPSAGFRKLLQRLADKYVQRYLFASNEMGADWVRSGIISDENKIVEVMEASSTFSIIPKEQAIAHTGVTGNPVFLFVGRLDANKDPLTVVKAFTGYLEHQPAATLYLIFHTDELKDQVVQFCEKHQQLSRAVKLIGKVPHNEMGYWYNSADFIISASHYEGSGVAVCEAMSCGCVPILTNIQSFRMMTGQGQCGFLYEPGNADQLLKILLQTRELDMKEEKKKTLQQFRDQLSFEAIAQKIEETVSSVCSK